MKTAWRNVSTYKMLNHFMISETKWKKIYIDKKTKDEANKMYDEVAYYVISPNDNRRRESYSWYSHVRYIQKEKKILRKLYND